MHFIVVIPARSQSIRLPGKPLIPLCGVPMIVRTYRQCLKSVPEHLIYVATDDEEIQSTCQREGIRVILTSRNCLTGTDRVAEVAQQLPARTLINVQGDEPLFNPDDLTALIEAAKRYPDEIINGYCAIQSEEQFRSHSIPKVVFRPDGRLLYMSRAPIPTDKKGGWQSASRQVCAYAFPRESLEAFSSIPEKSPLESIEDIEILRFLELGKEIRMIPLSEESISVDNQEDVVLVEKAILERGLV